MSDLKYAIFFAIAFTIIGYWGVQAIKLIDARVTQQLQAAGARR